MTLAHLQQPRVLGRPDYRPTFPWPRMGSSRSEPVVGEVGYVPSGRARWVSYVVLPVPRGLPSNRIAMRFP